MSPALNNDSPDRALLVIDIQNDFTPGGALAVNQGDEIVPLVNRLAAGFGNVVMSQDWHPAGHISFASSHPGEKPFDVIELPYGPQVMWPDHCIQGSHGAEFHPQVDIPHTQLIVRKGGNPLVDSYSAFFEADRKTTTGLAGALREKGIDTVYVAGLALDFCVTWTALDARREGFVTYVVVDACRAIDNDGSLEQALSEMQDAGVIFIQSRQLLGGV
ncbi:bifunctional nicotinamidase/pyrazinamidase [Pseudomonas sp. 148P]|uniref:nicotinamidase n=1 Tax=Pseudomonas ulcerans TaxID=3115852 RepID=A0ABU7HVI1_9PSED|nr:MULTISPECIES: bifunctional nicotinamidase/pyrazinamidase [unclassified Pseudomonas]MEE1924334.1 bifunctional nicotinamidase/pyrazinamidase [Pseudomonas sp. 147P]MEE1935503.1 bifunctional nicotinamidase/pyrazinamidase [Pseudomonas sp. 148P]